MVVLHKYNMQVKENKYYQIYQKLIRSAKTKSYQNEYAEEHHIVPKSLGGTNHSDNLVKLSAREHFIAHRLLAKFTVGKDRYKMICALLRMSHSNQTQRIVPNGRTYEALKKQKSQLHSQLFSGHSNPFFGKKHSRETIEKLRSARIKQVERQGDTMTKEARQKLSIAAKGRCLSDNHRQKLSESNKKTWANLELRQKASELQKGKIIPDETRKKLSEACRKAASKDPKPQVTCPYCGKQGGSPSMKRWHFDNCKTLVNK